MQDARFQIVIAEDNEADVVLVREALNEYKIDCVIHVLRDGEQALAFLDLADRDLNGQHIDLLVLDLNLPKWDGQQILQKFRSKSRFANTPVIVTTSMDATAPEMTTARELASVCFPKPSTLDEFLKLGAIIRELLNGESANTLSIRSGGGSKASQ